MTTCRGCGGLVGRDCFNASECEWISHDMAMRRAAEAEADRPRVIAIPQDADEAEAMVRIGMMYLQQHAPERIKNQGASHE